MPLRKEYLTISAGGDDGATAAGNYYGGINAEDTRHPHGKPMSARRIENVVHAADPWAAQATSTALFLGGRARASCPSASAYKQSTAPLVSSHFLR